MKKLIMLLVLSLLFGLMGCGPREASTEGTTEMEETTELTTELVPASADAVSTEEISVQAETKEQEEQIAVLVKERRHWLKHYEFEDGDGYEDIYYTIADLNQNGQLELVSYICEGSGRFTYYYVYEVTPEGTMVEWKFKGHEEGVSHMDIGTNRMTVYYNEEEGTYTYLSADNVGGIGGIGSNLGTIVINGRTIEEKYSECYSFSSADKEGVQYYDGDGKEISRKEYDKLVKKATPKGKKGNAYFGWECKNLEELLQLSEQEMKKELTKLSREFLVRLEQKSNETYNQQIQYLVSQKKEWMKLLPKTIHTDDETIEASYELMAMDLNQNGCMELGIKYRDKMLVFEVNKEVDGMTEWKCTGEIPDFSLVSAYHSAKDDTIHFVYHGEYDDLYKTQLTDTVLLEGEVKTEMISLADEELDPTSYYDGENKEITEQEYYEIEGSFYKDLTPMKLYVQSIISPDGYYFDAEGLNKITDEELCDKLQEGMECFYIE